MLNVIYFDLYFSDAGAGAAQGQRCDESERCVFEGDMPPSNTHPNLESPRSMTGPHTMHALAL